MTKTYRAGIIGLGFIGAGDQVSGDALGQQVANLDGTHALALAGHPRIKLVAGSSRDPGRRQRFAARTGATPHANWRDMLATERLDIVSIATYAPQHADMAIAAARQGVRAIYCEKPICTRLADADRMIAAAHEADALLVINHNRRFNPAYRRLRDLIVGNGLGPLTSVLLSWGSGRLGNVGTHIIDACRMLTGRDVLAVSATLDLSGRPDCRGAQFHDPGGWAMLRMQGGLMAMIDAPDYATTRPRIAIHGTRASAIVADGQVLVEHRDGRLDPGSAASENGTSMDHAVAEIVGTLDDGVAFPYPAEEAASTLEIIVACHASHRREARWVELPLSGPDREVELNSG